MIAAALLNSARLGLILSLLCTLCAAAPATKVPFSCPNSNSNSSGIIGAEVSGVRQGNNADFRDFGVQYWGQDFQPATLKAAPHRKLIIDPSLVGADHSPRRREEMFSRSDITMIRRGGQREVFGYLNVGELASNRDYWVEAFGCAAQPPDPSEHAPMPPWFGAYSADGELLAAFWTKDWERILQRRVDDLLSRGFDGVFLDDVLHYFSWGKEEALARRASGRRGPTTIAESARDMMGLIVRLSAYARFDSPNARKSFKVIVNGAPYIHWDAKGDMQLESDEAARLDDRYLDAIDAILVENALSRRDRKGLLEALHCDFSRRGLPVLTIESWAGESSGETFEKFRATMLERAKENGFYTYVVPNGLFDRLYPPISQVSHHE